MADVLPPIGSTPAADPCSPCAGPPTDCLTDLTKLQADVCALSVNYLDTIQKYGQLLSKIQAGMLSIKDLTSEIAALQAQINQLESGNCSGLGVSTVADAMIACLSGQEKAIAAPSVAGQGIGSFKNTDGNWQWQIANLGPDYLKIVSTLVNAQTGTSASQNFPVTLPSYPTFGRYCLAMFTILTQNENSGASSTDIALNGVSVGHCGPQSQEVTNSVIADVSSGASQTFNLTATGDARTWGITVILNGYLFR
jgi:hypothetical protein